MLYGKQFSTQQMGMQVSYRVQSKISETRDIWETQGQNQLQEDIINDQISLKEFVDPFKGEQVKRGK